MGLHRLLADMEAVADLAVGEAVGHELEHGDLAVAGRSDRRSREAGGDDRRRARRRTGQTPAVDEVQHPDLFALGCVHHLLRSLRLSSAAASLPWGLTSAYWEVSHLGHAFADRRRAVEQTCGTAGRSDILGMSRRTDTTGLADPLNAL